MSEARLFDKIPGLRPREIAFEFEAGSLGPWVWRGAAFWHFWVDELLTPSLPHLGRPRAQAVHVRLWSGQLVVIRPRAVRR